MKLIKIVVFLVVALLIFNYFGMLNSDTSAKVDKAVEGTLDKINSIDYKGKKLTDMSLKELSNNVTGDVKYLTESIVSEDGVKLIGKKLEVSISPTSDTLIKAKLDGRDSEAVKSIEKLIKDFSGIDYKIPENLRDKAEINLSVIKNQDGKFEVKVK